MSVAKTLREEIAKQKERDRERRNSDSDMSDKSRGRSRERSTDRSQDRVRSREKRDREEELKRHVYLTKNTNSSDPALLNSRVFIGNLPTDKVDRNDLEDLFGKYGRILAISILHGYGFVQFGREEDARVAVDSEQGGLLKGWKIDIKMAAEGRKQKNVRRSPPPRRDRSRSRERDRDRDRERERDRDRDRDRVRGREQSRDRDRSRREEDRYGRGLPPVRDPPPRRDSLRDDRYARDPYPPLPGDYLPPHGPLPPVDPVPFRPPFECEIVMTNPQLRGYAESIERQLKPSGMLVQHNVVKSEADIPKAIEDLVRLKVPYAVVIIDQNEVHRSITLNILHGTTQEHRNMPLDDALKLMSTNFEAYVQEIRDKVVVPPAPPPPPPPPPAPAPAPPRRDLPEFVPPDEHTHYLLNLLADNRMLTLEEIDHVLGYVEKRRKLLIDARPGPVPRAASLGGLPERGLVERSMSDRVLPDKNMPDVRGPDMLGLMGNDGGIPRGPGLPYNPSPVPVPAASTAAAINFNNPSVQKALDDLMQRGPNLLGGLGGPVGGDDRRGGPGYDRDMDEYGPQMGDFRGPGPQLY